MHKAPHKNSRSLLISLSLLVISFSTSSLADSHMGTGMGLTGNFTGNVAATSTYMWRGVAQTSEAAVQGGVDYSDPMGLHAGAWTSSVLGGSELDLTLGYEGNISGFNFDVGAIFYMYPQSDPSADFEEIYVGVSQGIFGAQFSTSSDNGEYIEVSANLPLNSWMTTLHFGSYSVDKGKDYVDYSVSLSKQLIGFNLGFMLTDTDIDGEDFHTVVTASKDFMP
jgi:uncharacterized protein (TIGR02001 family)